LDEPMSSLDTTLKADLLEEFAALQKLLGITTVYITHDPAEAAALAHGVAMMHEGRIEQTGTVEQLKKQLVNKSLLKNLGLI